MTDEQALEYGFDRKGPGTRCGTGFVCDCYWASSINGDKCPEHGATGTPITKGNDMVSPAFEEELRMAFELQEAWDKTEMPKDMEAKYCQSHKDGDCTWEHCPQNRDGEPVKTGRHCPLDIHTEERGYQ